MFRRVVSFYCISLVASVLVPQVAGTTAFAAVAESAHFKVIATRQETADELARVLEGAFEADWKSWFSGEEPPRWDPPCYAYTYDTDADYQAMTNLPPRQMPGVMDVAWENGRPVRTMKLNLSAPYLRTAIIPHEVMHGIVADQFGSSHKLPPWANEGMAVLCEAENRIRAHLANLAATRGVGPYSNAVTVLGANAYPSTDGMRDFYAGSVGLTRYLADERGKRGDFVRFMRMAMEASSTGYEKPLRDIYGLSFSQLNAGFSAFQSRLVVQPRSYRANP